MPVIQVAVTGKCTKLSVDLIVCLDFVWPLSLPHQHWVLIRLVYGYMLAVGIGKVQVLFRVLNYPGSGSKFGSWEPGYPLTSLSSSEKSVSSSASESKDATRRHTLQLHVSLHFLLTSLQVGRLAFQLLLSPSQVVGRRRLFPRCVRRRRCWHHGAGVHCCWLRRWNSATTRLTHTHTHTHTHTNTLLSTVCMCIVYWLTLQ